MSIRTTLTGTLVGAVVAIAAAGTALAAPEVNQPAPLFTGMTASGKTVDLQQLRGKVVVLEWTNHDCPYVRKHYGANNMQSLQKEAAAMNVVWLQVISSGPGKEGNVDGPTAVKLNAERGAAPTDTVLDPDGKIGKLYGAQTTPHMYVIDQKGVLVYKGGIDSIASARTSDIPKAVNYVRESLKAVTAGAPVPNAVTRPYGCTVHYSS
jgi:peroxiredoxin